MPAPKVDQAFGITQYNKLRQQVQFLAPQAQARALYAFRKAAARHLGEYSKYDGRGRRRIPLHHRA